MSIMLLAVWMHNLITYQTCPHAISPTQIPHIRCDLLHLSLHLFIPTSGKWCLKLFVFATLCMILLAVVISLIFCLCLWLSDFHNNKKKIKTCPPRYDEFYMLKLHWDHIWVSVVPVCLGNDTDILLLFCAQAYWTAFIWGSLHPDEFP